MATLKEKIGYGFGDMSSSMSVSYTHLDVYKRQVRISGVVSECSGV